MADSAIICSHCGKQGAGFKRCSCCKQASYCGAACQNTDWKRHKKTCAPLQDVWEKVQTARAAGDWRGVLKWEGRMEELIALHSDDACSSILKAFSGAHHTGCQETGSKDHARSCVRLLERWIPLLGELQRFRDQGETMCNLSNKLRDLERNSEAATWFQRARDVGAAHGLFTLESRACVGLGRVATEAGRHEEGLALLRNALVAAELNELDDPQYELMALNVLMQALFKAHAIDEVEPLVLRYREATQAERGNEGFCLLEFDSVVFSAWLHEVLCLCAPRWKKFFTGSSLLAAWPSRICHRVVRAREKAHAPVEPCALCRHAGSLERPRGRCALCSTGCERTWKKCRSGPRRIES